MNEIFREMIRYKAMLIEDINMGRMLSKSKQFARESEESEMMLWWQRIRYCTSRYGMVVIELAI